MPAILATIRTQCRDLIGDTSLVSPYFTDAILTDYINRAIADLNAHFPRRTGYEIACVAGKHSYGLLANHQNVLSVEYPTGKTPPSYLQRMNYTDSGFWTNQDHYDFIPSNDSTSTNPPRLIVSAEVTHDDTITLEITTEHNALTSPTDETTIPDRLLHLIALFVRWKTWEYLASKEAMDPNPLRLLATTQQLNALRAEASYRAALAAAKDAYTESSTAHWDFPDHDRIY